MCAPKIMEVSQLFSNNKHIHFKHSSALDFEENAKIINIVKLIPTHSLSLFSFIYYIFKIFIVFQKKKMLYIIRYPLNITLSNFMLHSNVL